MNTHSIFAAATLALATATGALAAPPAAESDSNAPTARTLSKEDVIQELVKFRQAGPTTPQPRDGEWYNVPAPVGSRVLTMGQEGTGPAQAMPAMHRADTDTSLSQ